MERLTYDFVVGENHCWQIHGADNELCEDVCKRYSESGCKNCPIGHAFDRLAAYEDTGLEPEEIEEILERGTPLEGGTAELMKEYLSLGSIDHLRELVQAEQDGRLVVLPCKVGDTVYRVLTTRDCPPVFSEAKIETVGQAADLIGRIGKHKLLSCYLTREEVEAALEVSTDA